MDNASAPPPAGTQPTVTTGSQPRGRRTPRRLSLRALPSRDARRPHRFTSAGTLALPAGMTRSVGCFGRVDVTFKARGLTISTRRVRLSRACTFRSRVAFSLPLRFRKATRLTVQARFQGNQSLNPRRSATIRVRVR